MEQIVLVNERDEKIGTCEKLYVHQKGYLHRAFSVFVFNKEGKMLLQKRALSKYHSGGLWTNSCCSHQLAETKLIDDIHARLGFELGIKVNGLKEVFVYPYCKVLDHSMTENEIDHIFIAYYDGEIHLNKDEASDYSWRDPKEILKDIKKNPDHYTYWFKGTIERVVNI